MPLAPWPGSLRAHPSLVRLPAPAGRALAPGPHRSPPGRVTRFPVWLPTSAGQALHSLAPGPWPRTVWATSPVSRAAAAPRVSLSLPAPPHPVASPHPVAPPGPCGVQHPVAPPRPVRGAAGPGSRGPRRSLAGHRLRLARPAPVSLSKRSAGRVGAKVSENFLTGCQEGLTADLEQPYLFGPRLAYACRSGERVPPMDRLHKRGAAASADNGEDPRAVFVQARLRCKPSRHSTHLADLKSPQKLMGRPVES